MLAFPCDLVAGPEDKFIVLAEHLDAILSPAELDGSIVVAGVEADYLVELVLQLKALSVDLLHVLHSLLAEERVDVDEMVVFVLFNLGDETVRASLCESLLHSLRTLSVILREWMVDQMPLFKHIALRQVWCLHLRRNVLQKVDSCEVANV